MAGDKAEVCKGKYLRNMWICGSESNLPCGSVSCSGVSGEESRAVANFWCERRVESSRVETPKPNQTRLHICETMNKDLAAALTCVDGDDGAN